MSSKKKVNRVSHACGECCFKGATQAELKTHRRTENCDKAKRCERCNVFCSTDAIMLKEHGAACRGKIHSTVDYGKV